VVRDGWIWSRGTDLAVFGGSAAVALALAGLGRAVSPAGHVPTWAWLVFVLAIDVAHVWTTLFRTYLDKEEVAARRLLYIGLPLMCYAIGVALHLTSSRAFWRALAYVAVFHFVRQQIGWVAIYRARSGATARIDRIIDDGIVYAATGFPLIYWHAHLPRAFQWFMPGDFVDHVVAARVFGALVVPAAACYLALAVAYLLRGLQHLRAGRAQWGKHLVVLTTGLIWFVGIVAYDDDFSFTVTNVTVHGIPYMALLWAYARARADERPTGWIAKIVGVGLGAFFVTALALAFVEEMLWDRFIWHERPHLFGQGAVLDPVLQSLLIPLLALPQAVHYALDGLLWRRKDAGVAQARALGFV
jgi:hypothetical protein